LTFSKNEKQNRKTRNKHDAREIEASPAACLKKGSRTPDKKGVFCQVERHAAEIEASRSDSYGKTPMICKKKVTNATNGMLQKAVGYMYFTV